jgi:hypothetical protein
MAENQLADAGSLGDAPDLGDIGERGGHPFELGPSGTVPLEISKVDDLVDQDVGVMGESDQASFTAVSPENTTEPPAVSNR